MDFTNTIQLLQYVKDKSLLEKLYEQLKKDFVLANIPFEVKRDSTIYDFKDLLQEKIYLLMMEHFDSYLNLLYIIDLPEKAFKKIIITDTVEVSQQVSFLILKRELQKILFKEKYSS